MVQVRAGQEASEPALRCGSMKRTNSKGHLKLRKSETATHGLGCVTSPGHRSKLQPVCPSFLCLQSDILRSPGTQGNVELTLQ